MGFNCIINSMIELTSKQRKLLERSAHSLEPVVIVGGSGLTDGVVSMTSKCLDAHELIKVSFNDFKDEKQELSRELSEKCDATLVRIIGNKAIFYKPNKEEDKRTFEKLLAKC